MELPKFLLADNSTIPDELFILHTEYPRFIINLVNDEIEWLDDLEKDEEEEEVIGEVAILIEEAHTFYDNEMAFYEEQDL